MTSAFGGQRSIQLSYGCIALMRLQSDSLAALAGQCLRNMRVRAAKSSFAMVALWFQRVDLQDRYSTSVTTEAPGRPATWDPGIRTGAPDVMVGL